MENSIYLQNIWEAYFQDVGREWLFEKQDLFMGVDTTRKSMHKHAKLSNNMNKRQMDAFLKDLQSKESE